MKRKTPHRRKRKSVTISTEVMNERQEAFVREYLIDFNGVQSAIRAGYSRKAAGQAATHLLKVPKVREAIRKIQDARARRLDITVDNIEKELAAIAFSSMKRLATWGPRGVMLHDSGTIENTDASAVAEVSQKTGSSSEMKIKLHDKVRALQLLLERHGHEPPDGGDDGILPWRVTILGMEGRTGSEIRAEIARHYDRPAALPPKP